jgi:PAS domain S-box-containing protein
MIRTDLPSRRIRRIWDQLTEPATFIQDEGHRQQSRLLSSLLLILIAVIFTLLPIHYFLDIAPSLGRWYIRVILLCVSYLLVAYIFSRRGHYQLGSGLIVIAGSATIFAAAILGGGGNSLGILYYQICIILFASLFFRVSFVIIISIIHVGIMLIFPYLLPASNTPTSLDNQITFHLVITAIILLFTQYREQLETSRQKRLSESEVRARSAETYFRLIFQHSPDAILLLDPHQPDWPIIDCNDETCRMNGYTRKELLGQGIDILHPAPTTREAKARNLELLRAKGMLEFEAVHRRKDGDLFTIHNSSSVINVDGRELVLGIDRDITDRKLAEQRQLDLTLERERTVILSNFIRDASHEFRTPLSIIKTNLYLLAQTPAPEKRDLYISGIDEQADGILTLVESLVTMARLDANPGFQSLPVDLNQLLRSVVMSRQHQIAENGIEIEYSLRVDLPVIQGDTAGLSDAFRHILDNALRYTPSGGRILLRTAREANCAVVEIQDSGKGIDSKDLPHIFERFYRVDYARSTRGFGLGLSIAQKIIQEHGGQIEAESEVGKGSLFRVKLPNTAYPLMRKA